MPRIYDDAHPIVNTKLIKAIKSGQDNGTDMDMKNVLNELFSADFIISTNSKSPTLDDMYDISMLNDEFGIYLPVFTNYFEMRKMEGTKKNHQALVMDMDEIVDLCYNMYDIYECNIQGIIIDPYSSNLFFDNHILDKIQQLMHVQHQTKIYQELHRILSAKNEDEEETENEKE